MFWKSLPASIGKIQKWHFIIISHGGGGKALNRGWGGYADTIPQVEAQSPQGGVLNLGNGFPNRGSGVPHNPGGGGH